MTDKVLVTPAELDAMMGPDVVVIDTRSPENYAAGHIPGAVNLFDIFTYLATSTPEGMEALRSKFAEAFGKAGLSGAETAVCYEGSMNSGFGMSCRGYFLLSWLGYEKAKVLHGGLQAWTAAGAADDDGGEPGGAEDLPALGEGRLHDDRREGDAGGGERPRCREAGRAGRR